MSRSLRVAPEHIPQVKLALKRNNFPSQQALATEMGMARATISNFLNGKPVDFTTVVEICEKLGLDWQAIAYLEEAPAVEIEQSSQPPQEQSEQENSIDIDALAQEVREKVRPSIIAQCGTMRLLDMTQDIGLNEIYTTVNILEEITSRRQSEISDLHQGFDPESQDFDRCRLSRISEPRVPGIVAVKRYSKLFVLGKPGAGKTTFLKYLAIECICGELRNDLVPIFITLEQFSSQSNQKSLQDVIYKQSENCDVPNNQIFELIKAGKTLILLDGLDEVREADRSRLLKEIKELSVQNDGNQFVVTCRIGAENYIFEKFTEVEVADFDSEQIEEFANNWFRKAEKPEKARKFMEKLDENKRIKELATNPLLLTLLCVMFAGKGKFKDNRSELYDEALELLLEKWDDSRDIERDIVYKNLSTKRKKNLLSEIAKITFEPGNYFFKKKQIEGYIAEFIDNIRDIQIDSNSLEVKSEKVLKSIEAQHGLLIQQASRIYSFSHFTFQEYFTARKIVTCFAPQQTLDESLQSLVSHITEKRWREIFLLAVGMSPSADRLLLLMKEQIDRLIADDQKLQNFLKWVNQKSLLLEVCDKPAAIRAFYLDIDIYIDIGRTLGCLLDFTCTRVFICASFLCRALDLEFSDALKIAFDLTPELTNNHPPYFEVDLATIAFQRIRAIDYVLERNPEPKLKQKLEKLKAQAPDISAEEGRVRTWWKEEGQTWDYEMKNVIVEYSSLAEDWQFSEFSNDQKELLKQYYEANLLLMQCLNSDCYVSREVRQEIEEKLLLPITEIERLKNKG